MTEPTAKVFSPAPRWIASPAADLLIGCGAWSIPLLVFSYLLTFQSVVAVSFIFYFLAVFCNNPHYMATIYRVYRTPAEFHKYRFFTVHITILMIGVAVAAHAWPPLVPWLFTVYVCWSPWHYTGQNFGIAMMFARRGGTDPSRLERNLLYAAFLCSYILWLLFIQSIPSDNPYLITVGVPRIAIILASSVLSSVFLVCIGYVLASILRRAPWHSLLPLLLLSVTQCTWFVLPVFAQLLRITDGTQVYFSTGALAFMHCAQYIWITNYYTRRESEATVPGRWNHWKYYVILVLGGIVLFVPGPWILSRFFHFDLVTSYLIFVSVVNLHHFILDGAIWKLRDGRIAALLLSTSRVAEQAGVYTGGMLFAMLRWIGGNRAVLAMLAASLLVLTSLDQTQYFLTQPTADAASLDRAAALNPSDSRIVLRKAEALTKVHKPEDAKLLLERAAKELRGASPEVLRKLASLLVGTGEFTEAMRQYDRLELMVRPDLPTLINVGLIAAQHGEETRAAEKLKAAIALDPGHPGARLNLAELLLRQRKFAEAAEQYEEYLALLAEAPPTSNQDMAVANAAFRLGESYRQLGDNEHAISAYREAVEVASRAGAHELASRSWAREAQLQEERRAIAEAVSAWQQAIQAVPESGDGLLYATHCHNFGLLLLEVEGQLPLGYALLLEAERVLPQEADGPAAKQIRSRAAEFRAANPGVVATVGQDRAGWLAKALVYTPARTSAAP